MLESLRYAKIVDRVICGSAHAENVIERPVRHDNANVTNADSSSAELDRQINTGFWNKQRISKFLGEELPGINLACSC